MPWAPSGPVVSAALVSREVSGTASTTGYPAWPPASAPCAPAPTRPLLTESRSSRRPWVEEASRAWAWTASSLGHQQLHVVLCSGVRWRVQGGLALGGSGRQSPGAGGAHSPDQVETHPSAESHPPEFGLTGYLTWRTPGCGGLQTRKSLSRRKQGHRASQGLGRKIHSL